MAGALVVLTVLMGVGIFGIATFMWMPLLKAMKRIAEVDMQVAMHDLTARRLENHCGCL